MDTRSIFGNSWLTSSMLKCAYWPGRFFMDEDTGIAIGTFWFGIQMYLHIYTLESLLKENPTGDQHKK